MEDKKITEKESLELIARMIRETQNNMVRYAAYPLLIWGYLSVLIAITVWCLMKETGDNRVFFLWFALPVLATPLTIYFSRKDDQKGAKNYIDRITTQIWTVFGIVAFCLSCFAFFVRVDILFLIPLLMGMASTLSGLVSKHKPLCVGGIMGMVFSFSVVFVGGIDQLLVFAAIFVVMMIIPGHILNKQMRQCSKN